MSQLLDARYQIIRVFSADAVCESYLTADISASSPLYYIVRKFFFHSQDEQTLNRTRKLFESEVACLQSLAKGHGRVQNLIAYWEEEKGLYLVQEYIDGYSLGVEIEQQVLKEEEVINLLSSILKTLAIVHNQGVIHRNIKPTNIIRRRSDGELILIDFGSIKEVFNHRNGDSEYMPMEQFHGNPQFNSDIYALGVTAIAALTGRAAGEIAGINAPRNFLTGEIFWRHHNLKVSQKLAKIINKMVRLDYRHRYQSVIDILADIRPLQDKYFRLKHQRQSRINFVLLAGCGSFIIAGVISWFLSAPQEISQAQLFYQQGINQYQIGNYKAAINYFNRAIKINSNYALAYNRRGDAFYRLGDYDKSQADSSEAIRLNSKDANSYYDRGFSLYSLGNYNGAIADYNQAIELDANNADIYYARGLARSKIKEKQAAIEDLNQAIALNPDYGAAYIERGKILRKQGKKLEALKDFDEAIALQPENPDFYYERGLANYLINQKQAAKKDFTKTIELNPKHIKAYLNRGDIYIELRDPEKAYADLTQAILLDDKFIDTYIHWGKYRLRNSDVEGALKDFNKVIQLEPDNASAYNYRGNANLEKGSYKEAISDYSKAIELNPDYALAYYNRGLVRTDLGRVPEAIEDFEKAAQFFQDKGEENSYNDAIAKLKALGWGK